MRLFISIEIPPPVISLITRLQKELKKQDLFDGTFISETNLHITIVFLGSRPELEVPIIIQKLQEIKQTPFSITLDNLELNSWRHPTVLWFSATSDELTRLAKHIESVLELPQENKREFKGHLTIARIKHVHDKSRLRELIESYNPEPTNWYVNSFFLKESKTYPEGPEYKSIATFNFGSLRK